jgi:small subunit ribosomal protein S6
MTLPAPTYDLVILLDPEAEEATRTKIVADARAAIEAKGEFLRHDEWGVRALTYPIDHKSSAEYHLLQLHATPELLEELNRTLRIVDEVVRFRIIKLAPGTPDAPEMPAAAVLPHSEPAAAPAAPAVSEPAAEAELAVGEPA